MTRFPAPKGGGYAPGGVTYRTPKKPVRHTPAADSRPAPQDPIVALVNQILNLQRAPLAAAEKQRQAQVESQRQQLANVSQGLVTQLQQAAPQTGAAYDKALAQTDALARNAASIFQGQNPTTSALDTLKQFGAPVSQQNQIASMNAGLFNGGPNYVLGGVIPGSELAANRAAQVGYAAGLPGVTALQGQNAMRGLLNTSEQAHQAYLQDLQKVLAQAPQLVNQYRNQAVQQANAAAQLANQKAAALANARYLAFQEGYRGKQLDLAVQKEQHDYEIAQQRADAYATSVANQGVIGSRNAATAEKNAATKAASAATAAANKKANARATAVKNRGNAQKSALNDVRHLQRYTSSKVTRLDIAGQPVTETKKVPLPWWKLKKEAMALPSIRLLQTRFGFTRAQASALVDQQLAAYGIVDKRKGKTISPKKRPR